jgi:hypothetical protein
MSDEETTWPMPVPGMMPPAPPVVGTDAINGHDAQLIWELVSNMRKPQEVLASYGLTTADLQAKARNGLFASAYREAEKIWKSDMNIAQRIRLKAAFLVEDGMLTIFNVIKQEGIGINAKLEAFEKLMKLSTVTNVPKEGATMEKHNITINIGGGAPPIKVVAETPSGTATAEIPSIN